MLFRPFLVLSLASGLMLSGAQAQSSDSTLNARDAFWSASDLVPSAPKPVTKVKIPRKTALPARPISPTVDDGKVVSQTKVDALPVQPSKPEPTEVAAAPLGLRYTLLKEQRGGEYAEVLPDSMFRVGDHVRVSIMANEPSYLYIVQQGSSGSWSPLYPQPGMANRVEAGKQQLFPPHGEFTFDGAPGEDKMFILLTRQPVTDLDETILSLRHDNDTKPNVRVASNKINDLFVQQFEPAMASRDLIFTKVDSEPVPAAEAAPQNAEHTEKAMYVVNQNKQADSKIVVQLSLKHQ